MHYMHVYVYISVLLEGNGIALPTGRMAHGVAPLQCVCAGACTSEDECRAAAALRLRVRAQQYIELNLPSGSRL